MRWLLGKPGTKCADKGSVKERPVRVHQCLLDVVGWSNIPKHSSYNSISFPFPNQFNQDGSIEPIVKNLTDSIEIRNDHTLQDDTHVGSKKQSNIDSLLPSFILLMDQSHLRSKPLQVNQNQENTCGSE